MSSLRNAAPRRQHRERHQPQGRQKWGLLEKHKDYSLRAADYNLKKKKLAQLAQKARDKHPDEFAFGMTNASTSRQGYHGSAGDQNRLSHDAVRLLKTQDAGYLRTVAARGRKEIARVEGELGLAEAMERNGQEGELGQKKVFTDKDNRETRGKKRNSAGKAVSLEKETVEGEQQNNIHETVGGEEILFQTGAEPVKPKSKKSVEAQRRAVLDLRFERKRRKRIAEARANKLEALKKRQLEIMAVADQLELQRAKMARTVGGVNKNGVKFKIRERKR